MADEYKRKIQDIGIYDIDIKVFTDATDEKRSVLRIKWYSYIGFGQYDIIFTNDYDEDEGTFVTTKIEGDSECMDSNTNKEFIRMLLDKLVDKMVIKEADIWTNKQLQLQT